jgi:tetratricopeptide (TPR) repeat protein
MRPPDDPSGYAPTRLAPTPPIVDPGATTGGDSGPATGFVLRATTGRYEIGAEIARGGMGVVYRARDTALGREVAVKVLQDRFGLDSGAARRFADEARIMAQLQHPAIPPVHDLGTLPDGLPFLAMKLIQGQTLESLLAARLDPSADRGRFVAAFEQVCQALAYAHAHGVIHRDLKPANVMVGAFGEVQVMDWGLAKVLAGRPVEAAGPAGVGTSADVHGLRDTESSITQAGSVLGTPAFMPPEQAAGAVGQVDSRSDVFGLGGILAVILTGQPPFAADSAEHMLLKAAHEDVTDCFARLDACGAEPELVALCRRCLSPKPGDRPADAGELARAVAELREAADERARRAETEKAAADVRAAAQRRQARLRLALAGAIGLLLLAGGVFAWHADRQAADEQARRGRNADAVASLLSQAEEALTAGDTRRAAVSLDAADRRAAEGGADDGAARLARLREDLAALRGLDAVDQFRWVPVENNLPDNAAVASRLRAALAAGGLDPDVPEPKALAARVDDSTVRDRLVAALDQLLAIGRSSQLRAALRAADPDPYRDAVRDARSAGDRRRIAELAGRPEAADQPSGFVAVLGEEAAVPVERRRVLLAAAVARRPGDLGLLMALGRSYQMGQPGADERLRWFQAAAAVAPANPAIQNCLGVALSLKKDYDGAIACYKEALRLDSRYTLSLNNLAVALSGKKDYDGAIAYLEETLRIDPKFALAHNNLGDARRGKKDYDGAVAGYQEALRLNPRYADAHINLGTTLMDKKDLYGAIDHFREAVRLAPKNANAHHHLAVALREKHDYDGAIACCKKAIRLDPRFVVAHNSLGLALTDKGDYDGAIASYQKALRLDPDFALGHLNLGVALMHKKDYDAAIARFQEALRLEPTYANAQNNLGWAKAEKGDLDGAIACFREAIWLDARLPWAHSNLGEALETRGDLDGAVACYREAVRLDPKHPHAAAALPRAERMQALLPRLPGVLAGTDRPATPREALDFADLCRQPFQRQYAAAVRLYEEAAGEARARQYDAACSAALAGCGEGADAPADSAGRAALRAKALAWLRAELDPLRKQAASPGAAARRATAAKLSQWLQSPDLAGVRPGRRIDLPDAERAAWNSLWADVEAALAEARKPPTPP